MSSQPIIVFDVNETLLDLEAIRPTFDRLFDDPAAMRLWFAGLITYSEALTLAEVYVPFTEIGGAVLRMLAATRGIAITDADGAELTERFASMPPHPEVPAALRRLRDHGFRLFTLTDNTLEISGTQLERAGVIDVFERRFSVDETVERHKPAPEAYHWVAKKPWSIPRTSAWSPATSGTHWAPWRPAGRPASSSARATRRSTSGHSRTTSGTTSTRSLIN